MSDANDPLADYPADEIRETVAHWRANPGVVRVRLPDGRSTFVVDPAGHLVVQHASVVERLCDAVVALLARAEKAEAIAAAEREYRKAQERYVGPSWSEAGKAWADAVKAAAQDLRALGVDP